MGEDVLKLTDDAASFCRVADPNKGAVEATLHELSAQGALLGGGLTFAENDYIDATLHLNGVVPRPMFAHVISIQDEKLLVRWLHFDGADEAKLKDLLERFRNGNLQADERLLPGGDTSGKQVAVSAEAAEGHKEGTRRIVRPSQVFTPFASKSGSRPAVQGKPEGAKPSAAAETEAKPTAEADIDTRAKTAELTPSGGANVVKKGTRRITRPSAANLPVVGVEAKKPEDAAPSAPVGESSGNRQVLRDAEDSGGFAIAKPGEDSGGHVVIAPTAKFEKMKDANRVENPQSTEVGGKAKVVVGADGKMDIGATIRSQAKTVRASELAARHDKVRVLNMGTIKLLIQDAVGEAMQHLTANMGENEKKQLLQEAEAQFQERLKAFKAEKESSDAYAKHLNDQLRKAQELLENERKREIKADQFTVSDAGMGQIEDKMKRVLDHAMRTGNVSPELETKLREMISHILDEERERIAKQAEEAQSAKIELLEKKINRLAKDLEGTERERDEARELANALEAAGGGGIRGIMTAGIKDSDGAKKRKLALMKEILDMNRKIRDELGVKYERDDNAVAKLDAEREKLPDLPLPPPPEDAKSRPIFDDTAGPPAAEASESADAPETEASGDEAEDDGSVEIDPDDMVWEVKKIEVMSDEERDSKKAGGIKKISTEGAAPPPMFKKPGG